ncbi:MAG: tyrosine-type recombinase/integrase [Egibacteraceae bacterium]
MAEAMVLGGLRRCEVLGLRLGDLRPGERRVFVAEGKGGRQRIVPVSARFFAAAADCLQTERPATASTDRVFVVLKGPRTGQPLSAAGLDEIVAGARKRAGIPRLSCHQLRHTCFARLREAGMALEAIQARPGTPPSSRRGSICTWPTTGRLVSICGRRKPSRRRRCSRDRPARGPSRR